MEIVAIYTVENTLSEVPGTIVTAVGCTTISGQQFIIYLPSVLFFG